MVRCITDYYYCIVTTYSYLYEDKQKMKIFSIAMNRVGRILNCMRSCSFYHSPNICRFHLHV